MITWIYRLTRTSGTTMISNLADIRISRNFGWTLAFLLTVLAVMEYRPVIGLVNTNRKICLGTSNLLSTSGSSDDNRYTSYKNRYSNCTYVEGNLELTHLTGRNNYDLSFLKDIEEVTGYILIAMVHVDKIPLTGLRMIRGYTKYDSIYSLYLLQNYYLNVPGLGVKEIQMPLLSEILSGSVYFYSNPLLCYVANINWADILPPDGNTTVDSSAPANCPQCHPKCNGLCWGAGPDMCQTLTRVICSRQCDARCMGPDLRQCCHKECAVGCTGPTYRDCLACRNFNNNGSCEEFCPPPLIYSSKEFKQIANPNFKYAYGSLCVDKCPDYLLTDGPHCVQDCGVGQTQQSATSRVCVKCEGACPKHCDITDYITSENIKNFTDCTIVRGKVHIIQTSIDGDKHRKIDPMPVADLWTLVSVERVTDFVHIDLNHSDLTNLTFLRNLTHISGRNLNSGRALAFFDTQLRTLDLVSLKEISNGEVRIEQNPHLCYADMINFNPLLISPGLQKFSSNYNRAKEQCIKTGAVCSEECSDDGCWGPGDDECLSCRNFKFGRRCINSCQSVSLVYQNSSTECLACHPECRGGCNDSLSNSCNSCKNVKDGPYCIAQCPIMKYPDEENICQECHEFCRNGCTGPQNSVKEGGCNYCDVVVLKDDGKEVFQCLPTGSECPDRYFPLKVHEEGPLKGATACNKCFEECKTCYQFGQSHCLTCLNKKELDFCDAAECGKSFRCVRNCSIDRYEKEDNGSSLCVPCDNRCTGGCTGPAPSQCHQCKQYTIYPDLAMGEENPTVFNCTEKCPDHAPYIKPIEDKDVTVCMNYDPNRKNKVIIIVCSVVGGCVLLGAIVMIIICSLSRRAKAEEETTRIAALISGVDENLVLMQPMNTSTANPDRAVLRLIKESELRLGTVLGVGAFGMVHKGFWYPESEKIKIPVAIKVLIDRSSPTNNQELLDEARIMASVHHDHCLRILAFCMGKKMMLITPMLPHGNLLDYIRKNKDHIGSKVMLNWCAQIAEGMKYLEERKIVHRDLAARNVLVQRPDFVKITDFGLSKLLDFDQTSILVCSGKMPIKWLALESIQHRQFDSKSDVWSYGVTAWEIFTYGCKPHEKVDARDIPELLEKGERLPQPEICTIDVYMLMIKCWVLDTDSRPSFKDLVEEFKKMARDPGRYLVIPGDDLMRLPSNQDDSKDFLRSLSMPASEGDELIVSADDYLQPRSYRHLSSEDRIEEHSTEIDDSPWDVRENSGNSDKSSLFDNPARATSPSDSVASRSRAVPPRQNSTDSSQRGNPSIGNTASLTRGQGNNAAGPTGSGSQRSGPEKNSRYTSDPCRAALEHQMSGGSSGQDSADGSGYDRSRGERYQPGRGRIPSSPNYGNSSNGQLYINDDAMPENERQQQQQQQQRGGGNMNGRTNGAERTAENLDYLQPKHSYNPNETYLQMLDSPDDTEPTDQYMGMQQRGGPAVSNPEYFDDLGQGDTAPIIFSGKQAPVSPQSGASPSQYKAAPNQFRPVGNRNDSTSSKEYYNEVPNTQQQKTERSALLQK